MSRHNFRSAKNSSDHYRSRRSGKGATSHFRLSCFDARAICSFGQSLNASTSMETTNNSTRDKYRINDPILFAPLLPTRDRNYISIAFFPNLPAVFLCCVSTTPEIENFTPVAFFRVCLTNLHHPPFNGTSNWGKRTR